MKAMLHTACGCSRWIEIQEKDFPEIMYVAIGGVPTIRKIRTADRVTRRKRAFRFTEAVYDFLGRYPKYEEIVEER
jgi:hypothetical protein